MVTKTGWGNSDGLFVLGGEIADNRFNMALTKQKQQEDVNNEPELQLQTPVTKPVAQDVPDSAAPEPEEQLDLTDESDTPEVENTQEKDIGLPESVDEETALQESESETAKKDAPESKDKANDKKPAKKLKKNNEQPKLDQPIKRKKILIGGLLAVVMAGLVLGGGWYYFKGRVLPNTYVANQKVAGLKQADLEKLINDKQNSFTIKVVDHKKTIQPTQKDIGLSFDTNQTVTNTMAIHRSGSFWQHIAWWQRTNIDLSPAINQEQLDKYLKTEVKTATKNPQDAKFVFDTSKNEFKVQKQVLGSGILVSKAADKILDSAKTASSIEVDVPTQALPAQIIADNLQPALEDANSYINTQVNLKLEEVTHTPTAAEKASWLKFTVNKTKDNYEIKVLPDQMKLYISGISAPFHQDVTQRITIKNKSTGVKTVLQNGLNGQDVNNQDEVSVALAKAFTNQQSYNADLKVTTTPYKTQDIAALKSWAYVSLSTQTLTGYKYDKPVKSFLISSGVPKFATPVGVFKVWYKTPNQTMVGGSKASGDYYDLPNVHWDTYFNGDIAVHEAYWHNNFGTPMSHGCLNASYDNAKWFYDFAPIGTTVVVVQ